MGYWSYHFMGGDTPMDKHYDAKIFIINRYAEDFKFTPPSIDCDDDNDYFYDLDYTIQCLEKLNPTHESFKEWLSKNIIRFCNCRELYFNFAFPYLLMELSIKASSNEEIKKLCELVDDGGASERGFTPLKNFDPNKEEETPEWYAEHFKRFGLPLLLIEDDDERKKMITQYFENKADIGLLGAIIQNIENNKEPKLINVH